jgi:hypothetical protein
MTKGRAAFPLRNWLEITAIWLYIGQGFENRPRLFSRYGLWDISDLLTRSARSARSG